MKQLLKVTTTTGMLVLLRMLGSFIIAKIVAIYTGPTGMAMLGQFQSMIGVLNGIITAPATSGVVRYTSEYKNDGYEACAPWWRAAIQWILVLLSIVIPLCLLFANSLSNWLFNSKDYAWLILLSCCVLPLSSANTLVVSVLNGQQLYRKYVVFGMLSVLVTTAVMVCLIVTANITGALIATSISAAVSGLIMLVCSAQEPWFKLNYWLGATTKKHKKAIGAYVLMAIATAVTTPVALIFVRNMLVTEVGWEQTGQWQAVWKISETYLAVITMALGTYFLPKLATIKGLHETKAEIFNTAKIVMPVVIALAFIVYLLRDFAISLLFTEEFRTARDLFAVQLCGDVVKILSWLFGYPMLASGATKWFIGTEVVFSFGLVLLSWFFVLQYGIEGMPIAYLVNYSICFLFLFVNLKRFVK